MADIFISYVEEDRNFAIDIAHAIESMGLSAWYYERDSFPGRSYLLQTGEEITACRAFIILISSHSIGSYQVKQEVVQAYENNKPFMPLLIDISHSEFQTRQPEWRAALGATASLRIPPEGVSWIIPQLTRGLGALGISSAASEIIRTESPIEAQHQEQLRASKSEPQRQQEAERASQPERPKHRDDDMQPSRATRLFSLLITRWWVGGSIVGACALVLTMALLAKKPQLAQHGATPPFGHPSVSPPTATMTAMDFYHKGQAAYNAHDYQGAVADLTQALSLKPDEATAYYSRGLAYYYLDDYKAAVADFTQTLTLAPKDATAYHDRGLTYFKLRDYEAAIADFTQELTLRPKDVAAYYHRGLAYGLLHDYKTAVADLTQALSLSPEYADAYYTRGLVHSYLYDYKAAVVDYTQALTLSPEYAEVYYERGGAHVALHDYEAALADYQKAAHLYQQQGKTSAYQTALDQIKKLQP
jgi:tetratricopeptide (TPR) repeat protein